MNPLVEYLSTQASLSKTEKQLVNQIVPIKQVDKGKHLLQIGQTSTAFFFLIKGCIRLYYRNSNNEKTAFFYLENNFVSSYQSYVHQTPAAHGLQAIESCKVAVIDLKVAQQLLESSTKFEFLARKIMEEELITYQNITANYVTLNAEERYQHLLKHHPQLIQRIPQMYLASYVGVAPETLSRIRKRIR